ncbi:MAG: beta-1,6-N-acetylglucosaminyltransferase, partial [Limosilactobacillus sp.]|uniref:beta-1,6-N-acetylglucosaminyltransferase n=1 Tax=Limosilactobacillus sp. TaxID=2773925 RepID=UPI00270C93F2|nr:beta-1,6-N-acetylglucosaminyltransferase [Limosilactobacillus sp.]
MQAVLILAHKDIDQLEKLCDLLTPTFNVYIHLDIKTKLTDEQANYFEQKEQVHVLYKYDIKWSSYNITAATVELMKLALEDPENMYFHLISGQDYPLKSPEEIYNFFDNDNTIYMDYFRAMDKTKSGENVLWGAKFYFNYNQINRRTTFGKIYHRLLILFQLILRVNKLKKYNLPDDYIYSGQEWIDIPRDALQFAIDKFDKREDLQHIFETAFCPDEMWLQTILLHSEYKDRIDKNIHRYINWTHKNDSYPAILDEEDYHAIQKGNF